MIDPKIVKFILDWCKKNYTEKYPDFWKLEAEKTPIDMINHGRKEFGPVFDWVMEEHISEL